jgi:pimeloyl-ACP methyl ester carboxylesterase
LKGPPAQRATLTAGKQPLPQTLRKLGEKSQPFVRTFAPRCIKGARFVSIPQATHWMQHDHAEAFNDAALAFLSLNGK